MRRRIALDRMLDWSGFLLSFIFILALSYGHLL
jgi:hypothetical protein